MLVPTHDHGDLLSLSVASALAQTVEDLEVFIVLDGADAETVTVAEHLANADGRVRLFRHAKGERHGEAHRHAALQEARGRIVCYLSDDDLWAPDHVEYMDGLLSDADFAHSLAVVGLPSGEGYARFIGSLGDPWYIERMLSGKNFIPLSTAGHTMAAYAALPVGWSPAPTTIPTDLHMWIKFLASSGTRVMSGNRLTVLHLPASDRSGMTAGERLAELASWRGSLGEVDGWDLLRSRVSDAYPTRAAAAFKDGYKSGVESMRAELTATRERALRADEHNKEIEELLRAAVDRQRLLEASRKSSEVRAEQLAGELKAVKQSVVYRAGRRLASIPVIGKIGRRVGMVLARRADR